MLTLESECYTIELGKVVKHQLKDFEHFIESTTTPLGIGYTYHWSTYENEQGQTVEALYKWTRHGRRYIQDVESESDALKQLEQWAIDDILDNNEVMIYLSESEAETIRDSLQWYP